MPLDLVLDEAARYRQKGESFDDGQRVNQVEPGFLLGCQRGCGAIGCRGFAVEFRHDLVPEGEERSSGVIVQSPIPLVGRCLVGHRSARAPFRDMLSTQLSTGVDEVPIPQ